VIITVLLLWWSSSFRDITTWTRIIVYSIAEPNFTSCVCDGWITVAWLLGQEEALSEEKGGIAERERWDRSRDGEELSEHCCSRPRGCLRVHLQACFFVLYLLAFSSFFPRRWCFLSKFLGSRSKMRARSFFFRHFCLSFLSLKCASTTALRPQPVT